MNSLFEYTDKLHMPYECFLFKTPSEYFPVYPHWHYFMEIIYVTKGTASINVDGKTYLVSEHELILFLPSSVHAITAASKDPLSYYVLKFDLNQLRNQSSTVFTPDLDFTALFTNAIQSEHANLLFHADDFSAGSPLSLFQNCTAELEKKDFGYQFILQSKIRELLLQLVRIWRKNGFDTDQFFKPLSKEPSIHTITEFIDQHAFEDLSIEEIAKMCHMSYSYFAKNFKEIYGQSCKKYIEFIRLCKVEDLLLFTNFDLTYISQETGFSDCSHLIHAFKAKNGVTPHQFRNGKR